MCMQAYLAKYVHALSLLQTFVYLPKLQTLGSKHTMRRLSCHLLAEQHLVMHAQWFAYIRLRV